MIRIIEELKKKYPNDGEFGSKVREAMNEFLEEITSIQFDKRDAIRDRNYEKAAEFREKEKEILKKVIKKFDLD